MRDRHRRAGRPDPRGRCRACRPRPARGDELRWSGHWNGSQEPLLHRLGQGRRVRASGKRCIWPGCGRTFGIQIDHTTDWQNHGVTDPDNADPLCTWHNPFKNNGYRITRDDAGQWHTFRPDGTEMRPI